MTVSEANRLSIMRQIDKKILTIRKASEELGVSERQAKRIRKRYLIGGEAGLLSRHRGKVSPNRIDSRFKVSVIRLLKSERYAGFGPTFAQEKLRELQGYRVSDETLRKWMIEEGLWETKARRERKIHQRRVRRARFGELLQGDGSPHAWFEERGPTCSLVIFVDDATSWLTAGKFVPAETTIAYQEILEEHIAKYGRPMGLYTDKHAIFRTSRDNNCVNERETHFGRVLRELDIELICAHSPQAKGRVERANATLQDRLIKEMRLGDISTLEDGNRFLPEFMADYNERFGQQPRNSEDAHRPMRTEDNLERIFARRSQRKLSKDLSFQYEGTFYQLHPAMPHRFRSTYVTILERLGKPILIESNGTECPYTKWAGGTCGKPKVLDSKELEVHWPTPSKKRPGNRHPWR
jgi:DNA-binding Lrp family transcriptional regulator